MSLDENIILINKAKDLSSEGIKHHWSKCLDGDLNACSNLKYYYMKLLCKVKPLYINYTDVLFYEIVEQSVDKALERALKFKIEDFETYMSFASQMYFKYNIIPENENSSLNIPLQLIKAFSKIEDVYKLIPSLENREDKSQISLISIGFEYPIFSSRLLYYSYKKWNSNTLRQVDIDLCVALLPEPQRIEWEIFYEKDIQDIRKTILDSMD